MSILEHQPHGPMADIQHWLEEPLLAIRPAGGHPMRAEDFLSDTRYVLRAEIPGVDPVRDVEVTVSRGILTIAAQRHPEAESPRHSEFRYGTFARSFQLPPCVNEDHIRATYGHGILDITGDLSGDTARQACRRVPVLVN